MTPEILCKVGVSSSFYLENRRWLDENKGRRLFFIEERGEIPQEEDLAVLKNDRRVKIFHLESPLQKEMIAKKIARLSAFKELLVLDEKWKALIEPHHLEANLITSDAAEFGVGVLRHLKKNLQKPVRSFLALKNAMSNVPAIIVGAGPSLEKNGEALKAWKDLGLIIASGSAIQVLEVEPDLAAAIDPHTPLLRRKFPDVALCFQGRTHPDSLKRVKGEKFYLPDSHFAFEPWLTKQQVFNCGWTVGNAGVAMAAHLGCNPIILVGMDYCYRGKQKYAGQKTNSLEAPLVAAVDALGEAVETQRDWLMAIRWMEEFAAAHPKISFINATADGMAIGKPFLIKSLEEIEKGAPGVAIKWKAAMLSAPLVELEKANFIEWKESLKRCKKNEADGEIAAELLLEPLWQIWAPMFERELMADPQPLPMAEKLKIQRVLFFQQIIEEHLKAL
jgi:hypothetical protein